MTNQNKQKKIYLNSLKFWISYFFYKFILEPFELKSNRITIYTNQVKILLGKILKNNSLQKPIGKLSHISSRFGDFFIRPKTLDIIYSTPSFERQDMNYLFRLINILEKKNSKALFLDIGANIGFYAITVHNKFKNLDILAFEPSKESFHLLEKNIELNNAKGKIFPYNFGLGETEKQENLYTGEHSPGSSSISEIQDTNLNTVEIKPLDSIISNKFHEYEVIIFKIDVEGYEKQVLEGSKELFQNKNIKFYFLIEDFVKTDIIDYMQNTLKADFITKKTPYNSWWEK